MPVIDHAHAPEAVPCLCLSHTVAVKAYAAAVEDAARAYASTLPEPCARAVVTFLRPDGSVIERCDVGPEPATTEGDATSTLVTAPRLT